MRHVAGARFEELRELCPAAEDEASLAIGMTGLVVDHGYRDRLREASQLASEALDPRRVDRQHDLDGGTVLRGPSTPRLRAPNGLTRCGGRKGSSTWPTVTHLKGNFLFGSPLALAITARGIGRYSLRWPGWRDDLRHGLAMARRADPMSHAATISFVYSAGILFGVLAADDSCDARERGCATDRRTIRR